MGLPIQELIEAHRTSLPTPYYLIDEARMLLNLEKISRLRQRTGVKSVLALKCFATWAVFDLMRPHFDGTTSSSPFEARLGYEKFGKEVHAYSVAFSADDIRCVRDYASKIIFNSVSQLERFRRDVNDTPVGVRVNPGVSHSRYDLADPAREHSRLGASDAAAIEAAADLISGVMFHCHCENTDFDSFRAILDHISVKFAALLQRMQWVSLGGGISFTSDGYPFDQFCATLAAFADRFKVQVYLEPGSAAVAGSGFLVTQVLDIVHNGADIAVVDASIEAHMLDCLIYRMAARAESTSTEGYPYTVAGRSCLAGDVFGTYTFPRALRVGDLIPFAEAADYTMVKKNWFNGVSMPAIVVRRLDGRMDCVRSFAYDDFVSSLS